jgi:hypothetical protein
MDFDSILAFISGAFPGAVAVITVVLSVLGSLVVIGTVIDTMIPDEKDGHFMGKVLAVPYLGAFLTWTTKFSPFNVKQ